METIFRKLLAKALGRVTKHLGSYLISHKYNSREMETDLIILSLLREHPRFSESNHMAFVDALELLLKIHDGQSVVEPEIQGVIESLGRISVEMTSAENIPQGDLSLVI